MSNLISIPEVERLLRAGQLTAAAEGCVELLRVRPYDPDVMGLAATIAERSHKPAESLEFLRRAADSTPGHPRWLLRYAQTLLGLGRHGEALRVTRRLEGLEESSAASLDALGTLLTKLEEPASALPYFERAVAIDSQHIDWRYNLAMAQRMVGDLRAAEMNLDIVIRARPLDGEAHHARSGLRQQTLGRNHVAELESALKALTSKRAWLPAAFALAKELEDLGEYARSFRQLRTACRSFRASLKYEVTDDTQVLDALRSTYNEKSLRRIQCDSASEECIFIVGLPRSGTTLVDRILGSHSEIYSAGELAAFQAVSISAVTSLANRHVTKVEFAEMSLGLNFRQLGNDYLQATRPRTGHATRFTDKRPLNCLYAGMIHAALPKARFIQLRRDPMDHCYAMYKTLFAAEYPFSYDLSDLAQYYLAWDRLMRHWEHILGESWLTVQYEDLVTDPSVVGRKMVAHCGLSWQPQCLEFHSRSAAVTTASAVQVRRAINSDSVGLWRRYADALAPLANELKRGGITLSDHLDHGAAAFSQPQQTE